MRNVVYLELIICRRPILFEHNCTFLCLAALRVLRPKLVRLVDGILTEKQKIEALSVSV